MNNGEGENMTVTWTVTKNGQPFYPYTQAQGNEHYTTIFYGSGTSTFSFVPDDAGTYQVTASVEKYIFNFSNGGSVQFIGPVTSVGTVVVAGLPPAINSFSAPRFSQVGQSVSLSASASDPSPVESPLRYSWDISRNGQTFQTGSGSSFSFTPNSPGVYAETLTVSDPAGRSTTQTATMLVSGGIITVTSALSTDTPTDGTVTLAEALEYTAAIPGSYEIEFAPSLSGQTITLPAGLTITGDVTIDGAGAPGLVLSGTHGGLCWNHRRSRWTAAPRYRFEIWPFPADRAYLAGPLTTMASSLSRLDGGKQFGAVTAEPFTTATAQYLTVIDSTIANNAATYLAGGGIENQGTLTLIDSTIAYNHSASAGGGLYNVSGGTVTLREPSSPPIPPPAAVPTSMAPSSRWVIT